MKKILYTRRQVKDLINENKDLKDIITARQEGIEAHQEILDEIKMILSCKLGESIIDKLKNKLNENK